MQGHDLWTHIHQTGPRQFCDHPWLQADQPNIDIADLPDNVTRRTNTGFSDFKNNNLRLQHVGDGGRGIFTGADLRAEMEVFNAIPFATAVEGRRSNTALYCVACHKTWISASYMTCADCGINSYCNIRCRNSHQTHHLECGTGFEFIDNVEIKCAIQMVLEAIIAYDNDLDALRVVVERLMAPGTREAFVAGIPEEINDRKSRLHCILRLRPTPNPELLIRNGARSAHAALMSLPKIDDMVRGRRGMGRFLKHLTTYFFYILCENGFRINLESASYISNQHHATLQRILIYAAISFANRTCVPNVRVAIVGNVFVGTTDVRIQRDQELTIGHIETISRAANNRVYLPSHDDRQDESYERWRHFRCYCGLCTRPRDVQFYFAELRRNWSIDRLDRRLRQQNFFLNY